MAIQANKPNSRVFLLLGIVLAAAAAVAVLLLVRSNAPANEVSVVVSDASIPAGTTLTPAMVIVQQVPAKHEARRRIHRPGCGRGQDHHRRAR